MVFLLNLSFVTLSRLSFCNIDCFNNVPFYYPQENKPFNNIEVYINGIQDVIFGKS